MNQYEGRKKARETCVRELLKHEARLGRQMTQREAEKKIHDRADLCDKKRDWK